MLTRDCSAAAAGIKRIMSVKGVRDVPVAVIVWSQVETAVTLICVGIPVCLPLWTRLFRKLQGKRNSNGPPNQRPQNDVVGEPIGLKTFGGSPMPGAKGSKGKNKDKSITSSLFSRLTTISTLHKGHDNLSDGQSEQVILEREISSRDNSTKGSTDESGPQVGDESRLKEVTKSWIVGASINTNEVMSEGRHDGDHRDDGIMTTISYEVKRVNSPK